MKGFARFAAVLGGTVLLLAAVAVLAVGWALWQVGLPDGTALLTLDGETVPLPAIGGGGMALTLAGLLLGLLAVAVMVPAALLFGLAMAVLALALVVGCVAGVIALLLSPLWLPLLAAVWLWRRRHRAAPPSHNDGPSLTPPRP